MGSHWVVGLLKLKLKLKLRLTFRNDAICSGQNLNSNTLHEEKFNSNTNNSRFIKIHPRLLELLKKKKYSYNDSERNTVTVPTKSVLATDTVLQLYIKN